MNTKRRFTKKKKFKFRNDKKLIGNENSIDYFISGLKKRTDRFIVKNKTKKRE